MVNRIRALVAESAEGAIEAHDLRTRHAGRLTFLEFHLVVPGDMTVAEAHAICDRIEAALRAEMEHLVITIHVEPEARRSSRACSCCSQAVTMAWHIAGYSCRAFRHRARAMVPPDEMTADRDETEALSRRVETGGRTGLSRAALASLTLHGLVLAIVVLWLAGPRSLPDAADQGTKVELVMVEKAGGGPPASAVPPAPVTPPQPTPTAPSPAVPSPAVRACVGGVAGIAGGAERSAGAAGAAPCSAGGASQRGGGAGDAAADAASGAGGTQGDADELGRDRQRNGRDRARRRRGAGATGRPIPQPPAGLSAGRRAAR